MDEKTFYKGTSISHTNRVCITLSRTQMKHLIDMQIDYGFSATQIYNIYTSPCPICKSDKVALEFDLCKRKNTIKQITGVVTVSNVNEKDVNSNGYSLDDKLKSILEPLGISYINSIEKKRLAKKYTLEGYVNGVLSITLPVILDNDKIIKHGN